MLCFLITNDHRFVFKHRVLKYNNLSFSFQLFFSKSEFKNGTVTLESKISRRKTDISNQNILSHRILQSVDGLIKIDKMQRISSKRKKRNPKWGNIECGKIVVKISSSSCIRNFISFDSQGIFRGVGIIRKKKKGILKSSSSLITHFFKVQNKEP